jgi:hypothetical protein
MSELFGNNAENLQKHNVMKDDFGWEVPLELVPIPSEGLLYHPDSSLYKRKTVKIKAMTAKEEDYLTSPALIKEGTALDYLLKSCLIEKDINVDEMIVGDKNAILTSIRITGYGTNYPVSIRCNSCSAFNDVNIDLSSLKIKRLKIKPNTENSNLFLYTLPVTQKRVLFKFNSIKDEKRKRQHIENLEKANLGRSVGNVTLSLEYAIQSIEGITDKNKIKHFILNMPARDAKNLRKYIMDHEPGIDMTDNFKCKNCNSHNKFDIPITSNFFWPSE